MFNALLESLKHRRELKRGWRLLRAGDTDALTAMATAYRNTVLEDPLQAMLAKCLADDDRREAARAAFNRLYASLKGAEDADRRYLKHFALFHLALIRNSLADAAYVSRKAREIRPRRPLRAFLPIPALAVPPQPGPAITSTL